MLVIPFPVAEKHQDPTKSLVFTQQNLVTMEKTALLTLVRIVLDANMSSKLLKNALLFATTILIAKHGEKISNLQTNANCHSVISEAEAVTEKLEYKLKNAKNPTNVKPEMTVLPPNLDLLAVSKAEEKNVVNTNAELIPTVCQKLIKNGDTAEEKQLDNSTVNTNQNVKEMKIAMTRTHVLVTSV